MQNNETVRHTTKIRATGRNIQITHLLVSGCEILHNARCHAETQAAAMTPQSTS